jgi:c(7)-type cytochrome triheme protein
LESRVQKDGHIQKRGFDPLRAADLVDRVGHDADFEFAGGSEGKVTYSHEKHLAKNLKCTECHTKIFKMTKGQRSAPKMADMENGQACGTCHNGQVAFSVKEKADCAKCHKK